MSAPISTSTLTMATWPLVAASISGVTPLHLGPPWSLTAAPASRRQRTMSGGIKRLEAVETQKVGYATVSLT